MAQRSQNRTEFSALSLITALVFYVVDGILAALSMTNNAGGERNHRTLKPMDMLQEYLDIRMIREHLDDIPDFSLPAGYSIRRYQPGDEKSWHRIHSLADKYTDVTPILFKREFGADTQRLAERQYYLIDSTGTPIGTASAWFDDLGEQSLGRVHWVAIVPTEHGKGLAKPLLTTVCNRLKELGHNKAHLTTQTVRTPAINLYLKFGFVPAIHSERDRNIWRRLQKHLKYAVDV